MFDKILVALDGSELGETALPQVEDLAKMAHSEVILFQAVSPFDDIVIVSEPEQ